MLSKLSARVLLIKLVSHIRLVFISVLMTRFSLTCMEFSKAAVILGYLSNNKDSPVPTMMLTIESVDPVSMVINSPKEYVSWRFLVKTDNTYQLQVAALL